MELYAVLSNSFSKIYIITDTLPTETQLDVYLQNELLGHFKTVPDVDSFTKTLAFVQTLTSIGTQYIFEFEPTDIDQTGTSFDPGVYHFMLGARGPFGVINDEKILCCLAKKLQEGDTSCGLTDVKAVNDIHALLVSANANLRMANPATAVCLYDLASYECNCEDCS